MTNREKVKKILFEIGGDKMKIYPSQNRQNAKCQRHRFEGLIGTDVVYSGEQRESLQSQPYFDNLILDMKYQGEKLGKIITENKFPHYLDAWEMVRSSIYPFDNSTEIKVFSPAWEKGTGLLTTVQERRNQLSVYHAPDETADTVVNRLLDVVTKSKDKALMTKKLSKLNLPSNLKIKDVDAISENLVQQIHEQNNGSVKNTDDGRTM